MLNIHSKLSDQDVTIFSVMSAMAQRLNALNMSQGFLSRLSCPTRFIRGLRSSNTGWI